VNTSHCCAVGEAGTAPPQAAIGSPRRAARRCCDLAGWIVPSAILALLPKCPACLAAYFAIGTGIGISMSTAMYFRLMLAMFCAASLSYLAASRGRRLMAQRAALR